MNSKIGKAVYWFWREWGKPLLLVLSIALPFRASIADWYDVPTGSMRPTILEGDRIFVNKLAYDLRIPFTNWRLATWDNPQRGEVIVLHSPTDGTRLVKRVIGVPGDVISLQNNCLTVNGQAVSYESLAVSKINGLNQSDMAKNRFFTENLPGKSHIVATIPSIPAYRSFSPIKVPEGKYFVMGDNRDNSADSRFFGFVDRNRITGQALAVVFSLDRKNYFLPRSRLLIAL